MRFRNIYLRLKDYYNNLDKLLVDMLATRICNIIPDKIYLKIKYRIVVKSALSFNNPETFNAKIQYLKLHQTENIYASICDKYEVRKYVSDKVGEEYLIPIIGIFNNPNEIDYKGLPDKIVIKCTHDSGTALIFNGNMPSNTTATVNRLQRALNSNYYYLHRERAYKHIKPRIICEELLEDNVNNQIYDYKFMCFGGKAKCFFVTIDRNRESGLKLNFYDMNWQQLPFKRVYPNFTTPIRKPSNFDKMVELAERLAEGFTFVRVDLYDVNNTIYFGEMTLYPGAGFERFTPEKWDYILGEWMEIPECNTRNRDSIYP